MLWIRIGFNADPDPALYLNADPDAGSQTNADPNPGPTFPIQKVKFLHKKHLKMVLALKTYRRSKAFYNGWKSSLLLNFCQFLYSRIWIRIRIPITEPDPREPNQCRSGSTTLVGTIIFLVVLFVSFLQNIKGLLEDLDHLVKNFKVCLLTSAVSTTTL